MFVTYGVISQFPIILYMTVNLYWRIIFLEIILFIYIFYTSYVVLHSVGLVAECCDDLYP